MKRSVKTILCLLVLIMFTSIGFSAWYFETDVDKEGGINGGVSVAPLIEVGSRLVIAEGSTTLYDTDTDTDFVDVPSFAITLDQGDPSDNGELIYFVGANEADRTVTTKTLTFTFTMTASVETDSEAEKTQAIGLINSKTVDIDANITFTGDLGTYIEATGLNSLALDADASSDATTTNLTRTIVYTVTFGFSYVDGQKPTNKAEWEAMNEALADVSYSVEVSATAA